MTDIKVSVAMLCYNHEKYIAESLESILSQDFNYNFEIIIGDDCSTDDSRNILKKYQDLYPQKIKVIFNEINLGIFRNFINVISHCKGDYFCFCSCDDYWIDHLKLQKQFDFLERNIDYGLIHTDADFLFENEQIFIKSFFNSKNIMFPENNIYENLLVNNYPILPCTVMLRKISSDIFYSLSLKEIISEDTFLWLSLSQNTKFKYLSESTAVRRVLEESASKSKDMKKMFQFRIKGLELYMAFMEKYKVSESIENQCLYLNYRNLFVLSFQMRNKRNTLKYYRKMLTHSSNLRIKLHDIIRLFCIFIPYGYYFYSYIKKKKVKNEKNSYNFT